MAWLFEKSATWRHIVKATRDSPSKFLAFGIVVGVVIPYIATDALISLTNPEDEASRMKMLQKRQGVEAATMARVNKARLQTLLTEVQNQDQSQERYQASLDGRTLGTSSGSSSGYTR